MKTNRLTFVALLIFLNIFTATAYADDWVSLSGTVKTTDGTPVCAMVLANGQHMFSCDPIGEYSLSVPLDSNGQITLYCFCEGMMPFKSILDGVQTSFDISMVAAEGEPFPWQLYDDFESGAIDDTKWSIDSSSADITIENGRAKFVYTGPSDDSSFLMINQCPADVIGIKAKVTITSCDSSEDFRARICMIPGYVGDNYYWLYLDIRPNFKNIGGGLNFLRGADHHLLQEFFLCRFENQIGTIGHTYTISAFYWDNKITFEAAGQGRQVFQMPEQFANLSEDLKGIGIRGLNIQDQTAGCTAYFDDVYIMRTGECIMND